MKIQLTILFVLMFFKLFGQSNQDNFHLKKERFTKVILNQKWEEPNKIINLIEPVIKFSESGVEKIGCSKLGGTPDLPKSIEWPEFENRPMVFFGQINLEDIFKAYPDNELPKKGMLYFFCYFSNPENEYGAEYEFIKAKEEYSVIYYENIKNDLYSTGYPKDLTDAYHFKASPLKLELTFQIPPTLETSKVELAELSKNDKIKYGTYIFENTIYDYETLLGTPYPIQYGVDYDWAYSYLGIKDFNEPGVQEKINKEKPNFINLLSFTMDGRFEKIGSSGCYFGINIDDLKKRKFQKTVFIMQDT